MCSTGLTSCHQNLLGGAGHQKGSNPEGELSSTRLRYKTLCEWMEILKQYVIEY